MLLSISIMLNLNMFRQLEAYEQILESYEEYMAYITEVIEKSNVTINQVDSAGHFSSDDEVGGFFEALKAIQTALNEFSVKNMSSEN
jgi:hypothetical protein